LIAEDAHDFIPNFGEVIAFTSAMASLYHEDFDLSTGS